MNKRDLRELRKHFSVDDDRFVINYVTTALIDNQQDVHCVETRNFIEIENEEIPYIIDTVKHVLSGKLGKYLYECNFTDFSAGTAATLLRNVVNVRISDSNLISNLISHIANTSILETAYAIIATHCTYTVFHKTKDNVDNEFDSTDFNFIVVAYCPIDIQDIGLIYNDKENRIVKKLNHDILISQKPSDGFMYPVFTDRSPDVNHVLYSTKNQMELNTSIVEDTLQCDVEISSEKQKSLFFTMLSALFDDEMSYTTLIDINQSLQNIVEDHMYDSEPCVLDVSMIKSVFHEIGVDDSVIQNVSSVFHEVVGNLKLTVSNLVDSKMLVKFNDFQISTKFDLADSIHTCVRDGRTYILINTDSHTVNVNGCTVLM